MLASLLIAASAAILLLLGSMHLLFTFNGPKFHPRDPALKAALMASSPVITGQTTMWRAAIGFHASHSMGAMLFGLIYGYLALVHAAMLWQSMFLLTLGLATLLAYVVLAKRYWFSVPFRGISLATMLYVAGLVLGA